MIENAGNFRPHFDCDGRGWMRLFSRVFANTDSVPHPDALPDLGGFANVHTVPNPMAQPTHTPYPTYLPLPTCTPYPTATPRPTPTPIATYTPYPTATPRATYTPRPTYTRRPTATPRHTPLDPRRDQRLRYPMGYSPHSTNGSKMVNAGTKLMITGLPASQFRVLRTTVGTTLMTRPKAGDATIADSSAPMDEYTSTLVAPP